MDQTRRETERIRLGKSIVVTVVRVAGDKVRLGIEAPADVLVLRDELDTRSELDDVRDVAYRLMPSLELDVQLDLDEKLGVSWGDLE